MIAVPPVLCYCLASIMMTVVNKVQEKSFIPCFSLKMVIVRGVRPSIQHDISTAINTERSLRCLCGRSQEDACNFFSGYRHARYQSVVSYQLSAGQRNLYWFKESGKYFQHSYGMRLREPSLQQYLSIPVYTIFKNLTIILIVRSSGHAVT